MPADFVASSAFAGARDGFMFSTGAHGVGYYRDSAWVRHLCSGLVRHSKQNLEERSKHADDPSAFMESELSVDGALKALKAVASAPEQYGAMVGVAGDVVALVSHVNDELSVGALELLSDLLEAETLAEAPAETALLVDALLAADLLQALVVNLERPAWGEDTGVAAVYNTLDVLENLVEARPELALALLQDTDVAAFLLARMKAPAHDANKLHCSELLGILLLASPEAQAAFGRKDGCVEGLLLAISKLRKAEPGSLEEEEFVANAFDALRTVLLLVANQDAFVELEGPVLMLKIAAHRRFAFPHALAVLGQVLQAHPKGCALFVDSNGLRTLFPLFMGRGLAIKSSSADAAAAAAAAGGNGKRKRRRVDAEATEERVTAAVVAVLFGLLVNLPRATTAYKRILRKFREDDAQKTLRLSELYAEQAAKLRGAQGQSIVERMDAGLETMQFLQVVVAHLVAGGDEDVLAPLQAQFRQRRIKLPDVARGLREMADGLTQEQAALKVHVAALSKLHGLNPDA